MTAKRSLWSSSALPTAAFSPVTTSAPRTPRASSFPRRRGCRSLYLPCTQGGAQQIGARIAYNEIDLVLFFCDPKANTKDVDAIARLCDQHSIPFASNVATAEVLVQGLRRGDLDWRDIVNPKKK